MTNKYLEKIAKFRLFNPNKERDMLDAIAIGGSGVGLMMGANNLRNSSKNAKNSDKQVELQHETVKALKTIAQKVN